MTLRLQTTLSHNFPTEREYCMSRICYSYYWTFRYMKLVLSDCADWLKALVLMCWSPWQSDRHFHIPQTGTRIQGYLYSKFIACDFWQSCIILKKTAFFQIHPESLKRHSENRQFHFHLLCQVCLSFHNKYCFWTYWDFPSNFPI